MRIADEEVTLSELVQHSVDTIARLNESGHRAIRLTRRDDEDLVLTTAARAEQDAEVVDGATRMLAAIVNDPVMKSRVGLPAIRAAYPWVKFLPPEDLELFITELTETLPAAVDLGNLAPVAQLLSAWRSTAEVHADPEIAAALRGPTADFGPVSEPKAAPGARRRRRSAR